MTLKPASCIWRDRTPSLAVSSTGSSHSKPGGFSLVEICIALGVFTFAIAGIIALICVSEDTNRRASQDTNFGLMTSIILSQLRNQGFTQAQAAWSTATCAPGSTPTVHTNPDFCFDNSGNLLSVSGTSVPGPAPSGTIYACWVSLRTPAVSGSASLGNELNIVMDFRFPYNGAMTYGGYPLPARSSGQILRFCGTLANYD